ncbi:hypothetical protein D6774_01470 [Candidatus Woesearchaeota archaeon]|jgi:hypothetical protein|nr:MAG: hypothetical protein D6774_01470 [Candidatus Woesearchaeota archaeon]
MSYYVNVEKPVETRKSLLQASKQLVISLQRYEDLKKIREQKLLLMHDLKELCAQTIDTIDHLKQYLPQEEVQVSEQPATKKKQQKKSELHNLEADLKMIEEKLKLLE